MLEIFTTKLMPIILYFLIGRCAFNSRYKDLPHIFERFYKGKNSSKDSVGIGLALEKKIIEIIAKEVKGKITPQKKSSLVIQIADILSEIKNPVISDDYIKVASFKLGVSEEILKAQVKNKQQDEFLILKVENELPLNINKIIQKDTQNQLELMEENLIKLGFSANDYEKQSYFREKIKNIKLNNEANSRVLQSIDKKIDEVNNVDELAKKAEEKDRVKHDINKD